MKDQIGSTATQEISTTTPEPLRDGERMSRAEFERRFDATPDLKKAELLEGVVYMPPPPVSDDGHGGPHFDLITWLGQYRAATPGVKGGAESSLRLDTQNMPQPDAYLRILPTHGGQAVIDADGYVASAPDLVAEVAASSSSYDLDVMLKVYQRAGVREYVVWRVRDRAIDWFVLRLGAYEPLAPDADGIYRSQIFPGLWLASDAMVARRISAVHATQQAGLTSPEHAAFVERLRQAAETG